MDDRIKKVIKNLQEKGMEVTYADSAEVARVEALKRIKREDKVGIGGSMTIHTLNLHKYLLEAGNEVYWHWLVEAENRDEIRKKAASADVYLTSTNALTEAGELINIDGIGNRVSGMIYGPKKAIIICGINKICPDIISAIDRIKTVACPQNSRRLGLKVPCAITNECNECRGTGRMCNVTTIINYKPSNIEMEVIIVNEELGF